ASYTSVFNPINPTTSGAMLGDRACYASDPLYGYDNPCPGQMFGDNAPGATWEWTFLHADLGSNVPFPGPPGAYFSLGGGFGAPTSGCGPQDTGNTPSPAPSPSPSCPAGGGKRKPPTPTPTP